MLPTLKRRNYFLRPCVGAFICESEMLERENIYYLRSRNVKRMLWPVDHDNIRSELKNEQLKIRKEFTEKYNFDFETDKPMLGKYSWLPLCSESFNGSSCVIEDRPCCSAAEKKNKTNTSTSKKRKERSKNSMTVPKKKKISPSSMTLRKGIV